MSKRDISGGLRGVATRRRLVEERIERTACAEQSHEEAVKSQWDWYRRRIAQAQEKAAGKPNAVAGLERLAANIAKRPLARREALFLMVIENRKGRRHP